MNEYTVMTLSYISRLALLEKADRTRGAVDDLVSVLRYMDSAGEAISTITAELKILEKMFALNKERKGQTFRYILNSQISENRCYLPKGLLITLGELAMSKGLDHHRDFLEVIVSVTVRDRQVEVQIKDNGSTDVGEGTMESVYQGKLKAYPLDQGDIQLTVKPGIATVVRMVFTE